LKNPEPRFSGDSIRHLTDQAEKPQTSGSGEFIRHLTEHAVGQLTDKPASTSD
jgi:hypothetical protein